MVKSHQQARDADNGIMDDDSFDSWSFSDEDLESGSVTQAPQQLPVNGPRANQKSSGRGGSRKSMDSWSFSDEDLESPSSTKLSKPTNTNRKATHKTNGRSYRNSLTREAAGGGFGKAAPAHASGPSSPGGKGLSDPLLVRNDSSINKCSLQHGQGSGSVSTITAPTKPESTSNNHSLSTGPQRKSKPNDDQDNKEAPARSGVCFGYDCFTKTVGCIEAVFNVVWAFKGPAAAAGFMLVLAAGGATGAALAITNRNDNNSTTAPADDAVHNRTIGFLDNLTTFEPIPVTLAPNSLTPTTVTPRTLEPSTLVPTTLVPTTLAPTTMTPTTVQPTTASPTTLFPSTDSPLTSTDEPTTPSPTTISPTTLSPTTLTPTITVSQEKTVCDSFLISVNPLTGLENQQCDKASQITPATESIITCGTAAFSKGNETDLSSCLQEEDEKISHPHLWYNINGTGGRITISTCHSDTNIDTAIGVFASSNCFDTTCLQSESYFIDGGTPDGGVNAANDNDENCHLTDKGASTVVFDSNIEMGYKFYVADLSNAYRSGYDGIFGLTVTAHDIPSNDKCDTAILVEANSAEIVGSTVNATINSNFDSCWQTYDNYYGTHRVHIRGATVWYKVVGHGGRISLTTCSGTTNVDTAIGVYASSDCFDAPCLQSESYFIDGGTPDGFVNAANDNDENCHLADSGASTVEFDSEVGQEYIFYVSDVSGRLDGTFGLTVTAHDIPSNDKCDTAMLVEANGAEIVGSTVNATINSNFDSCWQTYDNYYGTHRVHIRGATVWYKVVGTGRNVTISTCSGATNIDTAIGLYAKSDCFDNTCLEGASNDNDESCRLTENGASSVVFPSVAGQEYTFYVSDVSGRLDGMFGLTVVSL